MSSVGALPPEIITDVLSRLPVKSLCRFKSVSPSWNSLISDPHFAKTHLNRTKTLNPKHLDQKAIIISSSYNLYSLDFASVNPTATKLDNPTAEHHFAGKRVQVLSSCDGLLLVSYDKKFVPLFNFFLLNPCTREFKKLPAPPYNFNYYPTDPSLYGVVFDSSADDYKVVMLSLNEFHATMVDVYSLKTNAWRRIKVPEYIVVSNSSCGVFFNGCLHRIFWKLHGLTGYSVILAFNLSNEVFEEVPLPALLSERHIPDYREEVVGGCLCLVYKQPCDRPDVWMMKEYGVRESWTKNTLDLPPGTPWGPIMCLLRWLDKCLLYSRNGNKVVICDLGNETTRDMVVAGIPREYIFGATYVESLISPNQGGGIGRQEGLGGNKRQASSGTL